MDVFLEFTKRVTEKEEEEAFREDADGFPIKTQSNQNVMYEDEEAPKEDFEKTEVTKVTGFFVASANEA